MLIRCRLLVVILDNVLIANRAELRNGPEHMQCLRNKRSELSMFYVCECGFGNQTELTLLRMTAKA